MKLKLQKSELEAAAEKKVLCWKSETEKKTDFDCALFSEKKK